MFACLYIPDFPVEAVLRVEDDLRQMAVAVLEGKPPLLRVAAANQKARASGIEAGMTQAQAEMLPGLVLRPRSSAQEAAAHAALLDCAHSFSPRVEDTAADTVLLDLHGLERLFGPPPRLAHELSRRAWQLGLATNVAVASNLETAQLAARGFPGVTVIPPGQEAGRLGELSLEELLSCHLPPEDAQVLLDTVERWGIRNCRALAALPEVALVERLGQTGLRIERLARGEGSRPLLPVAAPLSFLENMELEHPVALLEPLAFILSRLLEQLCARLSARALATNELRLELVLDGSASDETESAPESETFRRVLHLPVPMLDQRTFLRLLQLELRSQPPPAPVVKVTLEAVPVKPRRAQGGLFLPPVPEPERLELILARIAGVVGSENLGCPELLDTYCPDTFRMRHFHPPGAETGGSENTHRHALTLALRRFRPPLKAMVELRQGRPARIKLREPGRKEMPEGLIIWAAGPWRSSGDWWRADAWARDEWDVAVETNDTVALYRLYRDLQSGDWFVEGSYD